MNDVEPRLLLSPVHFHGSKSERFRNRRPETGSQYAALLQYNKEEAQKRCRTARSGRHWEIERLKYKSMQCDLDNKLQSKKGGVKRLWPIRLLPSTHVSHTRSQQHTVLSSSLRNSATIPHLKTWLIPLQSDLDRIPVARDYITSCVSSVERIISAGGYHQTGG